MRFDVVTIFPYILDSYVNEAILKRAKDNKLVDFVFHNLRDWTDDAHKTVDDKPYGGGAGMVMKVEPIYKALTDIPRQKKSKVVLVAPNGKQFTQKMAKQWSKLDQIVFICGRYEGIDSRVEKLVDEKISIGPYVLAGGELPAMVIMEAISRYIPGVLGNSESVQEESHTTEGYLEFPQYTRPEIFNKWKVPKVLLGGNHADIKAWRKEQSKKAPK